MDVAYFDTKPKQDGKGIYQPLENGESKDRSINNTCGAGRQRDKIEWNGSAKKEGKEEEMRKKNNE